MKITVQREGYEVTANVYGVSGSPYLKASLEVEDVEGEITDPAEFQAAYGMEPTEANLAVVMKQEESRDIDAILEDAYDRAGNGGDY